MHLITTTEIRTKTNKLVQALETGQEISLVHRSKIIGFFVPKKDVFKSFKAIEFRKLTSKLNFPVLSGTQIGDRYREEMTKKHGKDIL